MGQKFHKILGKFFLFFFFFKLSIDIFELNSLDPRGRIESNSSEFLHSR